MQLEHVNLTVNDIEASTLFLKIVFPSLTIRGEGEKPSGGFWRHVGTDDCYVALEQAVEPRHSNHQTYAHTGLNHVGFVVNDIETLTERLLSAGYRKHDIGANEPGRTSVYFYDDSGIEWEFVQYPSDDVLIRNHDR